MIKMVAMLQPFEMAQKIYVYENGNLVEVSTSNIDNFANSVFALKDKYNATKMDLIGPSKFSKGCKDKIKREELTRYGASTLEINIQ